jgi:hypothetical protein
MLTPMCADQAGVALAAVVFDRPAGADGYPITGDRLVVESAPTGQTPVRICVEGRRVTAMSPASVADPPTERRPLLLSDHERQVLEAYVAPWRAGRLTPSTHSEVAERLSYSVNKTRRDLYGIWQQMVTCGVSVAEYGDKRVAVAHAALSNGLA